jgi:predicted O-methyltransferase YrrM
MKYIGRAAEIKKQLFADFPQLVGIARDITIQPLKRSVYDYQALVIAACVLPYNGKHKKILEIGTFHGYSCEHIALACPQVLITTLNPKQHEVVLAKHNLARYANVSVIQRTSVDHLRYQPPGLDFVFVDGDHAHVIDDMPYYNLLNVGGMMLFHDYSPEPSARACQVVYDVVNQFAKKLGRELDVMIMDDTNVGMAGLVKRVGEGW